MATAHDSLGEQDLRLREQDLRLREQAQRLDEQAQRLGEQERLLRAMLGSRAFAVAEHLSRLRQRGRPVFSRQQVRRALARERTRGRPGLPPISQTRYPIELPGIKDRRAGELYLHWFVELADLDPDEAVLEPGCGTGRMAEHLSRYLSATGSYDGFDIVPTAIEWCEANIGHPNFRFRHVDVFNRSYNPEGHLDPEAFAFPYQDRAFDFVFLTSVFTHMLPPEVRHYLGEIQRVLRPNGRCLATFFLLDEDGSRMQDTTGPNASFPLEGDGYRYRVAGRPEAAIAYRERDVLGFVAQAGLELHAPIRYGNQDTVVVRRLD